MHVRRHNAAAILARVTNVAGACMGLRDKLRYSSTPLARVLLTSQMGTRSRGANAFVSLRFDAAIDLIAPDRPGAEALCALFTLLSLSGGCFLHVSLVSAH